MKACVRCSREFDPTGKPSKRFCTSECARAARSGFRKNRERALLRDSFTCQICKIAPATCVHHIVFLSEGGTHDLSNLLSVDADCHLHIHGKVSRKSERKTNEEITSRGYENARAA